MRLEQYCADRGSEARLVLEVRKYLPRTTASTINRLKRGLHQGKNPRTASVQLALAIERATDRAVRAEELPLSEHARQLLRDIRLIEASHSDPPLRRRKRGRFRNGDGAAA